MTSRERARQERSLGILVAIVCVVWLLVGLTDVLLEALT